MRHTLHLVLAGPYPPDRLHSMERYARLLHDNLSQAGLHLTLIQPPEIFGRRLGLPERIRNYASFIDKFSLFPGTLRKKVAKLASRGEPVLVHILDQGNSLYARKLDSVPLVVTCHDLIAAHASLACTVHSSGRKSGRRFHHANLRALQKATAVVCVSDKTLGDCQRLFDLTLPLPFLKRVYNPLDSSFTSKAPTPPTDPFLLHIGNSAWYKNRPGMFRIYAALRDILASAPPLRLYGAPLTNHELGLIKELGLREHVSCCHNPPDEIIRLAYHQAQALIFPSLEEGFGWPPLEAMACGCPVFASNRPPLTEIGGDAAEYIDPENPAQAAAFIASRLQLGEPWRQERAEAGRARAAEFNMKRFTSEMIAVYESVLNGPLL